MKASLAGAAATFNALPVQMAQLAEALRAKRATDAGPDAGPDADTTAETAADTAADAAEETAAASSDATPDTPGSGDEG
jgi:large subunit ribosomal protein L10